MQAVVTGATGAIGVATTRALVRAGHRVRAFVRSPEKLEATGLADRVEVVTGDILDADAVRAALEGADAVVHCVNFPLRRFESNRAALSNVIAALPEGAHLVYPGNVWVYGPPFDGPIGPDHPRESPAELGRLKADLEAQVLEAGGTVIHLPDFYGPWVLNDWMRPMVERALAGRTVWFPGDLDREHGFIYIEDAGRALVAALGRPRARGREYTAPGYRTITPRAFASLLFRAAGHEARVRSISRGWFRAIALLNANLRRMRDLWYLFEETIALDGARIRAELGWVPEVDYPEGARRTVRWYREGRQPPAR